MLEFLQWHLSKIKKIVIHASRIKNNSKNFQQINCQSKNMIKKLKTYPIVLKFDIYEEKAENG